MSIAFLWLITFHSILFYLKHLFLMRTFRHFFPSITDHQWGFLNKMQGTLSSYLFLVPW